jgi:chitodextrinase
MAIDYARAYQTFIDEELAAASATEWMAAQSGQVRFNGGSEVEISTLSTTGLGTYDSTKTDGSAYPSGAVTSAWSAHTLSMDRGVKFALDRTDPSDSGFIATAENVVREFSRVQLVREMDTYRINRLFTLAAGGAQAATHILAFDPETHDAVASLCGLSQTLENDCERTGGFVALVSSALKNKFLETADNTFNRIAFEQSIEINGVRYDHVMMLNDLPCLFVPSARMKTAVTALSGRDAGAAGGLTAAAGAKQIHALVVACDAPLAVSRIDSLKQFGPEENQLFDGTAIQARYLYDLFVPGNKVCTIGALVAMA